MLVFPAYLRSTKLSNVLYIRHSFMSSLSSNWRCIKWLTPAASHRMLEIYFIVLSTSNAILLYAWNSLSSHFHIPFSFYGTDAISDEVDSDNKPTDISNAHYNHFKHFYVDVDDISVLHKTENDPTDI